MSYLIYNDLKNAIYLVAILLWLFPACTEKVSENKQTSNSEAKPPNIVVILADDLGYGDIQAYNTASKILTPHLNKLASEGMLFTDAHSSSAVCTPSRYSLLTGRYCWRTPLQSGVLWSYGRLLMDTAQINMAKLLRENGYRTGVIGKWHLGLDWAVKPAFKDSISKKEGGLVVDSPQEWLDFSKPITRGPNACGFDESYIIPASLDIPPYGYIHNDSILGGLSEFTEGNDLDKGFAEAFWRPGAMSKEFDFYNVLSHFTEKAIDFINESKEQKQAFFLYLPLNAPHTPWVASQEFEGSSNIGKYGDFVQQVDAEVGKVLQALEENGMSENTIVIFTSDNGPYWKPDYIEKYKHRAAKDLRGMKADIWEGGHRVPMLVKWPLKVPSNSVSNITLTHTALLATVAEVIGKTLPEGAGEDSESILPILLNPEFKPNNPRPIVNHSVKGVFAIRSGKWKLIQGLGSGGFSEPVTISAQPDGPQGQLYNLNEDTSEVNNVYLKYPEIVKKLSNQLDSIRNAKY